MKIVNLTLSRSAKTIEIVNATVNNKTDPTSERIITDLSLVLLEMYAKEKAKERTDE